MLADGMGPIITPKVTNNSKLTVPFSKEAQHREPFTARILVDTGDGWGPNAVKTISAVQPACAVLRFRDLASRPFDWHDLVRGQAGGSGAAPRAVSLRPHQQAAFDDVAKGFEDQDRGRLIMACGAGKIFTALRIAEAVAGLGVSTMAEMWRRDFGNGNRESAVAKRQRVSYIPFHAN